MQHFYQNIHGWFTFPFLYSSIVDNFYDGSHFVEVGAWKGKSASYMAVEIINSGKNIKFDCVDTWAGSEEHLDPKSNFYEPIFENGKDGLYNHFIDNMKPVEKYYKPIRLPSVDASHLYEDNSLDFVFIDAAHDYDNVLQDIIHWYPKVKSSTGIIAGHDYTWCDDVKRAVHFFFNPMDYSVIETEGCWMVLKP